VQASCRLDAYAETAGLQQVARTEQHLDIVPIGVHFEKIDARQSNITNVIIKLDVPIGQQDLSPAVEHLLDVVAALQSSVLCRAGALEADVVAACNVVLTQGTREQRIELVAADERRLVMHEPTTQCLQSLDLVHQRVKGDRL